jgi:hypothetical protein
MNKPLLIILALCSFIIVVSAQKQEQAITKADLLLTKGKPTLYITFERVGQIKPTPPQSAVANAPSNRVDFRLPEAGRENTEVVWLRLHNNTRWAINIPTDSLYIGPKTTLIRLGDGRGALASREEIEVNIRYEVEAEQNARMIRPPVIRRADILSSTWLASERSIIFVVPREYLAKNLMTDVTQTEFRVLT